MSTLIFDIETGALPRAEIAHLAPVFEAPGNYKDLEKIAAYIHGKEAEWYQSAALSALSGRVLAIGILDAHRPEESQFFASGNEAQDLIDFWSYIATEGGYLKVDLVGFNSNSFDLPFLIRRSWALGIRPPRELTQTRYLPSNCRDILDIWRCGNREDRVSLDRLAKFLGVGAKTGNGADFASLWSTDPVSALAYLENDLRLTLACAEKLNAVPMLR